jgi:predicted membrane chloride channel (bestrophin family)
MMKFAFRPSEVICTSLPPLGLILGVAFVCHSYAIRALPIPQIAIEPMQLTSFALSLLLVFRTNASYARSAISMLLVGGSY